MVYSTEPIPLNRKKMRIHDFIEMKDQGKKISSITCYDSSFAFIIEKTHIHCVLVGDSLGHVIQGDASTLKVTIDDIAYHLKCVSSKLKVPFLVGDMPFASVGIDKKETFHNAAKLIKAGAEAVKIEGASPEILQDISFLAANGIPVMGHIGLLPQSVHAMGGYKAQGKNEASKVRLMSEAKKLQEAGCFAVVLEMVNPTLAEKISQALSIPTIGIGSGNHCDGNILVLHDMLGMNSLFNPKFLKKYANLNEVIIHAINNYCNDVEQKISEPS